MKLREDKDALVLTGALGHYTVEELRKAALSTFPSVAALRGGFRSDGKRDAGREWHAKRENRKWKNNFKTRKDAHRAHECRPGEEGSSDEEDEGSGGEDPSSEQRQESGDDEGDSDEVPVLRSLPTR